MTNRDGLWGMEKQMAKLKRIDDKDRKKVMFQCEECGWESKWMSPAEAQSEPYHECKPRKVKTVMV